MVNFFVSYVKSEALLGLRNNLMEFFKGDVPESMV